MKSTKFSRRDFSQLSMAAIGGLYAGAGGLSQDTKAGAVHVDPSLLLRDQPNVCRGLNTCKSRGKGKHDCAGQGSCATAPSITCNGNNDCKGNGGCGGYP